MVFSSIVFLFVFLPAFLAIYYLTPFRGRSYVILAASYAFYAWWRIDFLALFVAVTVWNYWNGLFIAHSQRFAKRWLQLGLLVNLGVLAYFKYANFGIDNLNAVLAALGVSRLGNLDIILPIGISFYLFHCISYLVDMYRKDAPPIGRFVDFAAFIALFPQLICGPILRYKDLAPQFRQRHHSIDLFAQGVLRFMQGFVKKVMIADGLAPVVELCFSVPQPGVVDSWIGALAFCAQLYFDFSGYSSMAVGIGMMMGFRLIENFDTPFLSQSFSEFWRRWHRSLSAWLRDYVYIPLGGNKATGARFYRNLSLTMLASGIWHGANWTFVILSAFYGVMMSLERTIGLGHQRDGGLRGAGRILFCLLVTVLVMVTFRATSLSQAGVIYAGMLGGHGWLGDGVSVFYPSFALLLIPVAYAIALFLEPVYVGRPLLGGVTVLQRSADWGLLLGLPLLFALAISRLLAQSHAPFLYFAF